MMKFFRPERTVKPASFAPAQFDRRGLVAGAGVAGVAALAAGALVRRAAEAPPVTSTKPTHDEVDGYRETRHVLRYYETTRS